MKAYIQLWKLLSLHSSISYKISHSSTKHNQWGRQSKSTYIPYNKEQWFEVSTAWLLRNRSAGLVRRVAGNFFPKFRKTVPSLSSGLLVNLRTRNHEDDGGTRSFEKSESNYQTQGATCQKTHFLSTKTGLQVIKFSDVCYFQWVKLQPSRQTSLIFRCSIVSLACYKGDK